MAAKGSEPRAPDGKAGPDHQLSAGRSARSGSGEVPEHLQKAGLGTLLRDLGTDVQTLVKQEIELAKMEATRTAKRVVVDSAWIGAGVAVIAVAGLCLVLALALALGALLDSYWLGTLITGGILFLVGALLAWKGIRDLRSGGFAPEQTVASLEEDRSWARDEVDDFKQAMGKE